MRPTGMGSMPIGAVPSLFGTVAVEWGCAALLAPVTQGDGP